MPATEVISSCHDLWHVEQSFRMSKTDLRARPMFHDKRDAIEAHITIVFTALAGSRDVEARIVLTVRDVIRDLRPLRSAILSVNGDLQSLRAEIPPRHEPIIDALGSPNLRRQAEAPGAGGTGVGPVGAWSPSPRNRGLGPWE